MFPEQIKCASCSQYVSRIWNKCPHCKFEFIRDTPFNACENQQSNLELAQSSSILNNLYFNIYTEIKYTNDDDDNGDGDNIRIEDDGYEEYSMLNSHQNELNSIALNKNQELNSTQYIKTYLCLPPSDPFLNKNHVYTQTKEQILTKIDDNNDKLIEIIKPKTKNTFLYRLDENIRNVPSKMAKSSPRKMKRSNSAKYQSKDFDDPINEIGLIKQGRYSTTLLESTPYHQDQYLFTPTHEPTPKGVLYYREIFNQESVSALIKLIFNACLGVFVFYIIFCVIAVIRDDIRKKNDHEIQLKLLNIEQCAKEYRSNRCDLDTRLPALEEFCQEKEKCLNQDPWRDVHSSKVTAMLVAQIINEFIEPLGIKTLTFIFILLFGLIITCNCTLSSIKTEPRCSHDIHSINTRLEWLENSTKKQPKIYTPSK